jgi:adenylate kinase family enzyme
MARRVYVCGGPGAGKTTFAGQLSERTGLPIHHLDDIARVGGGRGPETTDSERAAAVDEILKEPAWIVEGVHLGWTQPLIEAADRVVWLDAVAPREGSVRIVRRFLGGAMAEARRRKGREKFLRVRDYGRKIREVVVSVPETRTFPRADLEAALAPSAGKLIHCLSAADVSAALDSLALVAGVHAQSIPDS